MVSQAIQIRDDTKAELTKLKLVPMESYDHVIKRLIIKSRSNTSDE